MCPECGEPLIVFELDGVEVDHCLACGGTWLDGGELELIAERAGASPGKLTNALEHAKSQGKCAKRCPRCNRKLQTIMVGETNPVELERCPVGHGLWFNPGEMRSVIAACVDEDEGRAVARFFDDLYRYEIEAETEAKGE